VRTSSTTRAAMVRVERAPFVRALFAGRRAERGRSSAVFADGCARRSAAEAKAHAPGVCDETGVKASAPLDACVRCRAPREGEGEGSCEPEAQRRGHRCRRHAAMPRTVAELVQAYLEAEVDELLGRARYARSDGQSAGYRHGHDPERTVISAIGPPPIRRPRVRGTQHESKLVPKYRRRLPSIDKTIHQLWMEGLAHRDFEPTLRGLLGSEAPLSASTNRCAPNESEARSQIETLAQSLQRDIPKRQHAYGMTSIAWSRSFAFRRRAGRVCVRPIRSNRSSPRCDYELTPRDVYEPEPRRRICSSSSFNACRPAGAGSTAIALSLLKTHRPREIISTPMLRRQTKVPDDRHELSRSTNHVCHALVERTSVRMKMTACSS